MLGDSKITLILVLMDGCYLKGLFGPQQGRCGPSQYETALISPGILDTMAVTLQGGRLSV